MGFANEKDWGISKYFLGYFSNGEGVDKVDTLKPLPSQGFQTVDKVVLRQRKGLENKSVSQMESAVGIHFRRGKQRVSRLLS